MKKEGVILIAEDDEGHFELIKRSLQRAGVCNQILRFADGQETLDFLFVRGDGPKRETDREYLLLLDLVCRLLLEKKKKKQYKKDNYLTQHAGFIWTHETQTARQ